MALMFKVKTFYETWDLLLNQLGLGPLLPGADGRDDMHLADRQRRGLRGRDGRERGSGAED